MIQNTPIMENRMEKKMEMKWKLLYIGFCESYMGYDLNSLNGSLYWGLYEGAL